MGAARGSEAQAPRPPHREPRTARIVEVRAHLSSADVALVLAGAVAALAGALGADGLPAAAVLLDREPRASAAGVLVPARSQAWGKGPQFRQRLL